MSLNRAGDGGGDDASSAGGSPRKGGRRKPSARLQGAPSATEAVDTTLQNASYHEAWPTWDTITGTAGPRNSAAGLASLVANNTQPKVSDEEAEEYSNWLAQFRALTSLAPGSSTRIADADRALYNDQADLAAGEPGSVARIMSGISGPDADDDADSAPQQFVNVHVDAALLTYAVTAMAVKSGTHNFQPSEAKLRAYNRWLAG